MAAGWAAGSAAVLALSVGALALDPAGRTGDATGPARALVVLLTVAVHLAWALSIARAAHGARGAQLALLGHALVWGVGAGLLDLSRAARGGLDVGSAGPLAMGLALLLAGLGAALATAREARSRRGPLQAMNAVALLVPSLLLAGLLALLGRA